MAWEILRGRRLDGMKWRRQQVISGFIVDFYCAEHCLILEVDGDVHDQDGVTEVDDERSVVLARQGICAIRIRNERVNEANLRIAIRSHLHGTVPPLP